MGEFAPTPGSRVGHGKNWFKIRGIITSLAGIVGRASGQILFDNIGVFGEDANLFWDNTNKLLGVGTNNPSFIGGIITTQNTTPTTFYNQASLSYAAAGNPHGQQISLSARGTPASPTAIQSLDIPVDFKAGGYNGVGFALGATFSIQATQNWTNAAQGMRFVISTTANNTTNLVNTFGIEHDGGGILPLTVTGGTKGQGTINVSSGYYIQGINLAGNLPATATNDSANAGNVGEAVTGNFSGVSVLNATATNLGSISLTAGDWDVEGVVAATCTSGAALSTFSGWISTVSATYPGPPNSGAFFIFQTTGFSANGVQANPTGKIRMSLASTTTIYLSIYAGFPSGTVTGSGYILARRVR